MLGRYVRFAVLYFLRGDVNLRRTSEQEINEVNYAKSETEQRH